MLPSSNIFFCQKQKINFIRTFHSKVRYVLHCAYTGKLQLRPQPASEVVVLGDGYEVPGIPCHLLDCQY